MSHDKIKAATRERMARTGEPYATARRRVIAELQARDPAVSAGDIRAAAAAHNELGPEFSDAVVASFLAKVEDEITARVDARLADAGWAQAGSAHAGSAQAGSAQAGSAQVRPPEADRDPDSLRTLLKGIAIGIAICVFAGVAVGGNPGERQHRLVLLMLLGLALVGAVTVARRLLSRRHGGQQRLGPATVPSEDRHWPSW